jgi:hypothetical protein
MVLFAFMRAGKQFTVPEADYLQLGEQRDSSLFLKQTTEVAFRRAD